MKADGAGLSRPGCACTTPTCLTVPEHTGLVQDAPELNEKLLWSTVSQPSLALAEGQEVSLQQSGALVLVRDAK